MDEMEMDFCAGMLFFFIMRLSYTYDWEQYRSDWIQGGKSELEVYFFNIEQILRTEEDNFLHSLKIFFEEEIAKAPALLLGPCRAKVDHVAIREYSMT